MRAHPHSIIRNKASGFTLIEVIIAMSIFAIVSLLAYSGLNTVMMSKTRTEVSLERLKELQLAILTLTDDFQHLSTRDGHDALGGIIQKVTTENSNTIVEFTRSGWRNPANQVRSTLQRVSYRLDDDSNLIRAHWTYIDRADDEQIIERLLIRNIEALELRFMDDKREWIKQWPSANSLASVKPGESIDLPYAIEIKLEMGDWGEIKRLVKGAPVNVKTPKKSTNAQNSPNTANSPNASDTSSIPNAGAPNSSVAPNAPAP